MFLLTIALFLVNSTFVNGINTNFALGKPTTSSSNTGGSGRCVDGNRDTNLFSGSCWESSGGDMQPFWMVDLEANYFLSHVTITNRGDCCAERLHDLKIEVFVEDPVQFPTTLSFLCAMYEGPMPTGATENISCSCLTRGRYLRIEGLNRVNDQDRHTMCEVETFGTNANHCFTSTMRRIEGTRFDGDLYPVDVTSTVECANVCFHNSTCFGFNFNHDSLLCELRVGSAQALAVSGWSYFVWERCI
ncbi:fucolectin-like [Haliotis rubra]|uniref:fucolectin-like n=1 Tax=Haliotis rubra TaxID=36100 RepID=UPI001EE60D98|nr:fucolectin-like [Haliotis rubra]